MPVKIHAMSIDVYCYDEDLIYIHVSVLNRNSQPRHYRQTHLYGEHLYALLCRSAPGKRRKKLRLCASENVGEKVTALTSFLCTNISMTKNYFL